MNKRKIRIYMIIFSFALILFIIGRMRLIKNVETVNPKFPEKNMMWLSLIMGRNAG